MGLEFDITAPPGTVSEPLVLRFRLDSSALPSGFVIGQLTVLRDGAPASNCTGAAGEAVPDPCVAAREQLPDGDVVLTVLSSHASTWTGVVDQAPPDTRIDSGPSSTIKVDEATFTFSGDPSGDTSKIQCRLDSGAFADCTRPKTFSGLSDGFHTVSFRAEDEAGNQDPTPATRTFTVDTAVDPPVVDPPDPAGEARIAKVSVKGPRKAKRGKKTIYRVKITNSGDAVATGVKLKVSGKGLKAKASVGTIPAGKAKTVRVKVKPKKKGKVRANFKATSSNAGTTKTKKVIKVK